MSKGLSNTNLPTEAPVAPENRTSETAVKRGLRFPALVPALCTSLTMLVLTGVLQHFNTCPTDTGSCKPLIERTLGLISQAPLSLDRSHELARVSGLLSWTIWSLLYAVVLVAVVVASILVLYKNKKKLRDHVVLVIILGVMLVLLEALLIFSPGLHTLMVAPFTNIITAREPDESWYIGSISLGFKFLSYLIPGWLVLVGAIVLSSAMAVPPNSGPDGLQNLSRHQQQIQLLLYGGALLLTTGVIHIQTVYAWAHAFLAGTDGELKAIDAFISTLITFAGLSFSALLAAAYLPAALLLTQLAEQQEKDPEILAKYDLNFSLRGFMVRAATILAPLLTVPLTGIVGQIFKAGG